MTESGLPRLRPLDARPFVQQGRSAILLRDPLQLSDKTVVCPQQLAPLLALCDGTRDSGALMAALAVRYGLRVRPNLVDQFLAAMDEAFLLDNDRSAQQKERALEAYREGSYRPPIGARTSYPARADELARSLEGYLDAAQAPDGIDDWGETRGLVSPHIDYQRGGLVYGRVWKGAAEAIRAAEMVVILGTDHFGQEGAVTLTRQHYATPFGVLPTATQVVDDLAQKMGKERAFADELHHRSEHAIELAAVWLHHVREGKPCTLVPILVGSFARFVRGEAKPQEDLALQALVRTLGQLVRERGAMIVAAGDLSHVGPAFGGHAVDMLGRARLQNADDACIERMCAGDAEGFFAAIQGQGDRTNVCGLPPIYLALRALSPVQGKCLAYERCPADQNGTSFVSVCGVLLK